MKNYQSVTLSDSSCFPPKRWRYHSLLQATVPFAGQGPVFTWVCFGCLALAASDLNRITESQNRRGWKGPLWVNQSNPLPKQGHLQQAAQDLVQAGLEYLQRRLHNLPGQPGPGVRHPQREEVLPHVQTELPVLQFVNTHKKPKPQINQSCRTKGVLYSLSNPQLSFNLGSSSLRCRSCRNSRWRVRFCHLSQKMNSFISQSESSVLLLLKTNSKRLAGPGELSSIFIRPGSVKIRAQLRLTVFRCVGTACL